MSALLSLPIIKDVVGWLRNHELIEYLKCQIKELKDTAEAKDKHIEKLYRRVKKAEKL